MNTNLELEIFDTNTGEFVNIFEGDYTVKILQSNSK